MLQQDNPSACPSSADDLSSKNESLPTWLSYSPPSHSQKDEMDFFYSFLSLTSDITFGRILIHSSALDQNAKIREYQNEIRIHWELSEHKFQLESQWQDKIHPILWRSLERPRYGNFLWVWEPKIQSLWITEDKFRFMGTPRQFVFPDQHWCYLFVLELKLPQLNCSITASPECWIRELIRICLSRWHSGDSNDIRGTSPQTLVPRTTRKFINFEMTLALARITGNARHTISIAMPCAWAMINLEIKPLQKF